MIGSVERRVEVGEFRLHIGDQVGHDRVEAGLRDQRRGRQARQVDGGGGSGKVHRRPCRRDDLSGASAVGGRVRLYPVPSTSFEAEPSILKYVWLEVWLPTSARRERLCLLGRRALRKGVLK
ncbi:hypothetical protein [uncultured Sphingomonas sp.]|uniref:hypothetical protein n=1 Tax=uncultured Sphingomonas sp. TaxID=158754 RepID=UPI0025FA6A02|nr:hypothetical protein [uncultured Sphingomonas sp.]